MWQVTLVALLVSASDRMLREARARYRHVLWVAALAACVALALGTFLRISSVDAPGPLPPSAHLDRHPSQERLDDKLRIAPVPARAHSVPSSKIQFWMKMPMVRFNRPLAITIVSLYGFLLLYRAGVLFRAWARTCTLLRSARQVELSAEIAEALACCRRSLNLKQVQLLSSAAVAVPVTMGMMPPALILPVHLLAERDIHLLVSALGHEAAHIVRRDYLLNLVYELASLPLWFHPGMRLILRRIRQTRELRCDEIVTERLLQPRVYAQSLVQLAGGVLPLGRPATTITVGIADADILEERIMSILNYSPARLRRGSARSLIVALLLAAPCLAAGLFAVQVVVHQPGTAATAGQSGAPNVTPTLPSYREQQAPPKPLEGGIIVAVPPQAVKPGPPRVSSGVAEGNLTRLIEPSYPKSAKAAGIQGDVVLRAVIGKTGKVEKLRVISGPPILQAAALEAVKQWKYDPYILNRKPVEIETMITFRFRLGSQLP
jgi:TonB family protein